ncbi:hypothetical protein EsH8_I_001590 [Colletotrichum jinshuiense]
MSSTQDARQSQHIPSNGLDGYVPYEARGGQDIIPYNRRWHIANMTIRGFDLAFCIIVIVITARISSSLYSSPTFLLCSGIPAVVAAVWNISEFVTTYARGGRQGIHPGAHVSLHLLLWLFFMIAIIVEGIIVFRRGRPDFGWQFGQGVFALQNAVLAITAILFLDHSFLLVRACVETYQRNTRPTLYLAPINAPVPIPAGSYAPYPYPPRHENAQLAGVYIADKGVTPPGPDGTYYGPGSRP